MLLAVYIFFYILIFYTFYTIIVLMRFILSQVFIIKILKKPLLLNEYLFKEFWFGCELCSVDFEVQPLSWTSSKLTHLEKAAAEENILLRFKIRLMYRSNWGQQSPFHRSVYRIVSKILFCFFPAETLYFFCLPINYITIPDFSQIYFVLFSNFRLIYSVY